jgi:hypothetical protein
MKEKEKKKPRSYLITYPVILPNAIEAAQCPNMNRKDRKGINLTVDIHQLLHSGSHVYRSIVKSSNLDTTESILALIL